MTDTNEGDGAIDSQQAGEKTGPFSKSEHTYALGRTAREQSVVLSEQYLTPNPKPHTDELGPVFPQLPSEKVEPKANNE